MHRAALMNVSLTPSMRENVLYNSFSTLPTRNLVVCVITHSAYTHKVHPQIQIIPR